MMSAFLVEVYLAGLFAHPISAGVLEMENGFEIIELNISDYVSPECSCRIEDMVNAIPHVLECTFDPITNTLSVSREFERRPD